MSSVLYRTREDERGIAIVVVLAVMLVLLILSSVVVASAVDVRTSSSRNRNSVLALEAAQAGLDVASYRMNQKFSTSGFGDSDCIQPNTAGTALVAASPSVETSTHSAASNGDLYCSPVSSSTYGPSLAGNASYTYWDSVVMTGGTCGSLTVTYDSTVRQRCLVSVGTANGVNARLTTLLNADITDNLLAINGIKALGGIPQFNETGHGTIQAYNVPQAIVQVNGPNAFDPSQCSTTPGILWEPGPGATDTGDSSCTGGTTTQSPAATSQWPQTTTANTDQWFDGTQEGTGDTSISTNNDDNLLTLAGFGYTAAGRVLKDNGPSNPPVLTLNGTNPRTGTDLYVINVCAVSFNAQGTGFILKNGAVLNFLIDSPSRTVSGGGAACSGSQANPPLTTTNNVWWNYNSSTCTAGDPTALRVIVAGTGNNPISMSNSQAFSGILDAPGWNINDSGGSGACGNPVFYGAINTNGSLKVQNGMNFFAANESSVGIESQNSVYARNEPQGWAQCQSAYSSSSPDTSC